MSYEDKVERFWQMVEDVQMDCVQIALYLGLIEIWKRNDCPSILSVKNEMLCDLLGTSIRPLREARKQLVDKGLFKFVDGRGRKQPQYMLDIIPMPDELDIPIMEPEVKPPPKKKKPKKKIPPQGDLFSDQKKKAKKTAKPRKEYISPTLDEVKEIFRKLGSTDQEAEAFFYYYDSQDWYKANGKNRIVRVDSAINSWISNRYKKHGTDKTESDKRKERNDEVAKDIINRYM